MKRYLLAIVIAIVPVNSNASIVLDFEGAWDFALLDDFYNGGIDSSGNSGTNYGIEFSGALALIDSDVGGFGDFANEPSADTVLLFSAISAVLNYSEGFDTGFSFFIHLLQMQLSIYMMVSIKHETF